MPARIVLTLQRTAGSGDGEDGPALQAALLGIVNDYRPDFAAAIHQKGDRIRPYALTTTSDSGRRTRVEIGVLDDQLVSAFLAALDAVEEITTLRSTRRYELIRGDVYPTPYEQLVDEVPTVESWKIELLSPYMIRRRISRAAQGQKNHVLPEPSLFLPRLERVFLRFAGMDLPLPVDDWVEHAAIKSIGSLETKLHLVETAPRRIYHLGTIGRLTIGLLGAEPAAQRSLGILLSLANYSGLGDKTTVGMGHARCTPVERSRTSHASTHSAVYGG